MKKNYIRIAAFYILSALYLVLYVGINILLDIFPEWIYSYSFILLNCGYVITFLYVVFLTFFVYKFSEIGKKDILKEILILDVPALLAITYTLWRRFLFNHIDMKHLWIRSYIVDDKTASVLLAVGSVIVGVEIIRYHRYLKVHQRA